MYLFLKHSMQIFVGIIFVVCMDIPVHANYNRVCRVAEIMNAGGYTYFRCHEQGTDIWVAVMEMKLAIGVTIKFQDVQPNINFTSKSLNKTFDRLVFPPNVLVVDDSLTGSTAIKLPQESSDSDIPGISITEKKQYILRQFKDLLRNEPIDPVRLRNLLLDVLAITTKEPRAGDEATELLIEFGEHAIDPLIQSIMDSDDTVLREFVEKILTSQAPAVFKHLIASIGDENGSRFAEEVFVKMGAISVVPLLDSLENNQFAGRYQVVRLLGKFYDPRVIDKLINCLDDADINIVISAIDSLGELKASEALIPLMAKITHEEPEVRVSAIKYLGAVGDKRAVKPLVASLSTPGMELLKFDALEKIGDSTVLVSLVNSVKGSPSDVRWAAAKSIAKFGGKHTELIQALIGREIDQKWYLKIYEPTEDSVFLAAVLEAGADPNVKLPDGNFLLHEWSRVEFFDVLVNYKADINVKNAYGQTPLIWFIFRENWELFGRILIAGADVNLQDREGKTALHYAVEKKIGSALINNLIDHGAAIDVVDFDGNTPLLLTDDPDVMLLLIQHGANPARINNNGEGIFKQVDKWLRPDLIKLLAKSVPINKDDIQVYMALNDVESLDEIITKANYGDNQAAFIAGMSLTSDVSESNSEVGNALLRRVAEAGNMHAQYRLGNICNAKWRECSDERGAKYWYRLAALQGHSNSMFELGKLLIEDAENLKAVDEGITYLQKVANAGNIAAQQKLSSIYAEKETSLYNINKAIYWQLTAVAQKRFSEYRENPAAYPLPSPPDGSKPDPLLLHIYDLFNTVKNSTEQMKPDAVRNLWPYEKQWEILAAVQALASNSVHKRLSGLSTVKNMYFPPATPYLLPLIEDPVPVIRRDTLQALANQADRSVLPFIAKLLSDPVAEVRMKAVLAVASLTGQDVVDYLRPVLNDQNESIQLYVALVLARYGEDSALPILGNALKRDYPLQLPIALTSESAMRATAIGNETFYAIGEEQYRTLISMAFSYFGSRAVNALVPIVKVGNSSLQNYEQLQHSKINEQTDSIVIDLANKNEMIRESAALALGLTNVKDAIIPLTKALEDRSQVVREAAIIGLLLLQDDGGVEALADLGRKGELSSMMKNYKLFYFKYRQQNEILLGKLAAKVRTLPTAAAIDFINLIRFVGDKNAIKFLKMLLDNPEYAVAITAADNLATLEDDSGLEVIKKMCTGVDQKNKYEGVQILAKLNSVSANNALAEFVRDNDPKIAREALESLLINGDRRGLPALNQAMPEKRYSRLWFNGMAAIGGNQVVTVLTEALNSDDHYVRVDAAKALGKLGSQNALPALKARFDRDDIDWFERLHIAESMLVLGDSTIVDIMINYIKDKMDSNSSVIWESLSFLTTAARKGFTDPIVSLFTVQIDYFHTMDLLNILAQNGVTELVDVHRHNLRDLQEWRKSLQDIPSGLISPLLYDVFVESMAPYYFGEIIDRGLFDQSAIDRLLRSDYRRRIAYGWYLQALRESIGGSYQNQLTYSFNALNHLEQNRDPELSLLIYWLISQAEIRLDKPDDAVEHLRQADVSAAIVRPMIMLAFKKTNGPDNDYYRGVALVATKRTAEAEHFFTKALNELKTQQFVVKEYTGLDVSKDLKSKILKELGQIRIKDGINTLYTAIELGKDVEIKDKFSLEQDEISYQTMISMKLGETPRNEKEISYLVEQVENRRSTYLSKQINISFADLNKRMKFDEYRDKEREIKRLERDVALQNSNAQKDIVINLKNELSKKNAEFRNYLKQLEQDNPDLMLLLGAKPIELKSIQKNLLAGTAFIQYLLLKDTIVIIVLKSTGPESITIHFPKIKVEELVKDYRNCVEAAERGFVDSDRWFALDRKLYDLLIEPIKNNKMLDDVETLGISPNGSLHYIPFASLTSEDKELLGERFAIFYANSTSLYAIASERAEKNRYVKPRLVAYVDPDGSLPSVLSKEMPLIKSSFPMEDVKEYPGKSVTRNKVVSEDYSASIVHFSTHGFFMVPSDKSYLVLSDSKLTVQDIWGLPLDRSVMVTLSACETGKGLVLNGDEVISLENAFIYAGAPSVLATLWQVEAESAAILTGSFYKYLMSGKNKAVSLKLAQDDVRHNQKHDYSSPYYWAGYTLRGAWHEINPNNSK